METTFYDDPQFRPGKSNFGALKRPVTLDLDSPQARTKKQKFNCLLTSPDLNMLKLASPDLERLIMAQTGMITTTPTPTQMLFPTKVVTEEQEQYARGFLDALSQLHHQSSMDFPSNVIPHTSESLVELSNVTSATPNISNQTFIGFPRLSTGLPLSVQIPSTTTGVSTTTGGSTTSGVSTTSVLNVSPAYSAMVRPPSVDSSSSSSYSTVTPLCITPNISIKEEPQTVPSDCSGSTFSPPVSPINMEDQERAKLERKRHRNRIAASKCRKRKLERISKLEDKVRQLKGENSDLGSVANKLREQVCQLKQQVLHHIKHGCQIMTTQNF